MRWGLNANFYREEFQKLWKEINHKYVYTVSYDTEELIKNAILHLNSDDHNEHKGDD